MFRSKRPLGEILRAGGWKSSAFMAYLQMEDVDEAVVFDLICEAEEKADAAKSLATAGRGKVAGDIRTFLQGPVQSHPEQQRPPAQCRKHSASGR